MLAFLLGRHGVLRLVFVCVYFSLLRDWSVSVLCVATSGGRTSPAVFTVKWTMRVCNIYPTTQTVSTVLSHVIPYKKIWIQKHNRRKKVWYAPTVHTDHTSPYFSRHVLLVLCFWNLDVTKKKTSILKLLFVPKHIMLEAWHHHSTVTVSSIVFVYF